MLGFEELIKSGYSPQEARNLVAKSLDEKAIEILRHAASTPEGRRFLLASLDDWRSRGVEPPWADIINVNSLLPQETQNRTAEDISITSHAVALTGDRLLIDSTITKEEQ